MAHPNIATRLHMMRRIKIDPRLMNFMQTSQPGPVELKMMQNLLCIGLLLLELHVATACICDVTIHSQCVACIKESGSCSYS